MPIPEVEIIQVLTERGRRLATAESCSGGLIAHRLTNVAGASACFLGGVVVYSNEMKVKLLGVSEETLAAHGAVSKATAREMAAGARTRLGADYVVAVTGIAGPGGGTVEKPVGLVYIAVAAPGGIETRCFEFAGDRDAVKSQTAESALAFLREKIE